MEKPDDIMNKYRQVVMTVLSTICVVSAIVSKITEITWHLVKKSIFQPILAYPFVLNRS